ncbi:class I SAM-dependent methyltransferase [Polaromonas jejuensis]|uniref:Class I SAM-dependent methyltransferase n=1 Tax=Polaromonas jejuensis TaxID=457502 RepID=A0ABW0QF53_9BURK|nr:methyltransferase domain-containing protein [Polaromonas jejuensis]
MLNKPSALRPTGRATPPARQRHGGQLRDGLEFLRGFLRHPARVGSVVPSSRWLEQRLVREARVAEAHTVVELGPGTGGTTAAFLRAMRPEAQLLAIELDAIFDQHLRSTVQDPRFTLELGSAEQLQDLLAASGLPAPDAIVSGIPFSTMAPEAADRIAAAIAEVLRPGGRFVAYQVRAQVAAFVSPRLGQPQKRWEVVNVPPVRVFTWVKPLR